MKVQFTIVGELPSWQSSFTIRRKIQTGRIYCKSKSKFTPVRNKAQH
jgi:hypothetical protein